MLERNCVPSADRIRVAPFMQKYFIKLPATDGRIPQKLFESTAVLPNGIRTVITEDGAIWLANGNGITRLAAEGEYKLDRISYFSAPRYLFDNNIRAMMADGNGIWVATDGGVSHIWYESITYEKKAAVYDCRILSRQSRHGFVSEPRFEREGDFERFTHESADNDGLWTAMYAAGACYEYAVTGTEGSYNRALTTVKAVLSLMDVTGRPGYPARSFIVKGEKLPKDGFWIPCDDGSVIWKSDTSSDEIVGHVLIYLLAHELLPDADIKARTEKAIYDLCTHMMTNGRYLVDVTGKPTRWGKWSVEYFNGIGRCDSPLNAAEYLAAMKVGAYLTGEKAFEDEYRKAAVEDGYADIMCEQLIRREEINFSDEELCYLSSLPLILLEEDEGLRAKFRTGMSQWWENIRREANPLWTYIYKLIATDEPCDMEAALWTLRRLPMDMRYTDAGIANRADLEFEEDVDRFNKRQFKNLLPPDERRIMKWNGNPFVLESGGNNLSEEPGTVYTFPYWLARYYGFIEE